MAFLERHAGLYTDHYELAMAQGYFANAMHKVPACFDYFYRQNPFQGGYAVFAGLRDLLEVLERIRFDPEDLGYLNSIGFSREFVDHLGSFTFRAAVHAPEEGDVIFPYEPVVRVEGGLLECQLVETLVLNVLNFATLVATKAARIRHAAGDRVVADFGLRRAQGPAGILASRAAVIGGVNSTSNVYSAFTYGLTSTGTQAHSWIQAHNDELTAFRAFARAFPERCILLVDTYDTLRSGLPHAITVGREMDARGERLYGIRLDSGDLAYLSKKARAMLDDAGLHGVRIIVSNQLDEHVIKSLIEQGSPVDGFGVGTRLVTGHPDGALDGVYKLSLSNEAPRLKLSETMEKISLPGRKKVFRCFDEAGLFSGDCIALDEEQQVDMMYHPHHPEMSRDLNTYRKEPLLRKVMDKGTVILESKTPEQIAGYCRTRLGQLPGEHQRFENPHVYKVGISRKLKDLRAELIAKAGKDNRE